MTFAYRSDYLADPVAYPLDPQLPLDAATHQTAERSIFGAFGDGSPDRWGSRLIERSERRRARSEGAARRSFGEIDYLLGVRDDLRQGALRFREHGSDTYLAEDETGVPALVALPRLLDAAGRVERDRESNQDLADLIRAGSSLGGARPKAHVIDAAGRLSIAKFPSPAHDDRDVMRWEAVTLTLARDAGIRVPGWSLHPVADRHVLVLERFDRADGVRLGYVGAMTLLEAEDRESRSYLEIAEQIEEQSPEAVSDLRELWFRLGRRDALEVLAGVVRSSGRWHQVARAVGLGAEEIEDMRPAFDHDRAVEARALVG